VSDGSLLPIVARTVQVAAVATAAILPFAVALGYAFARTRFRGKAILQAIVALPMVLPPVAVGLGLLIFFSRRGPLANLWDALGVDVVFTWWAAAAAAAAVGFPLLVRSSEQAFAQVERRYELVSHSLGLGRVRTFFAVTLPLARRGVLYGTLLAFTRALGEFGATAMVAGIIPGRTETIALGIYSRVQIGNDAEALWLCAASIAIAAAAMLIAEGWLRESP